MRTYFDKITGAYLGVWNWPAAEGQTTHPSRENHPWKDGQVGSANYRLNLSTDSLEAIPVDPVPSLDQFLTDAYAGCLAVATGTAGERLIEVSRRMDQYPSFVTAAQRENLALLQVVIARAHADYLVDPLTGISPAMEAAIQAAMVANHLVAP